MAFDWIDASFRVAVRQEQYEAWQEGRFQDLQYDENGDFTEVAEMALLDHLEKMSIEDIAELIMSLVPDAVSFHAYIRFEIAKEKAQRALVESFNG